MKTIHIILNAHIDPVWLWPWQSGLDEVLATCRSACDRLDANPDITFTRGEAWVYEQIERIDPALFERIRHFVRTGRWEIVGGWYIQPDCNLPSHWAMERQIGLGKAYFEDRFGIFPRIAYNVDSFGHAAALPGLMRAAGQDCYIATRPSQQELPLPARLFRWRGYTDGPEVLMCRPHWVAHAPELNLVNVGKALEELPESCEHTLCFVGVGDHGGGPSEQQIAWLRRHAEDIEGARIEFSSLYRFFECIRPLTERLPLFVGELQHHAIGCYSVYRPVKTAVRRAEHRLAQAETLGSWDTETRAALDAAWKRVCFHHFHDTLGGACVPSAYVAVLDQLGGASAAADEALQYHLRRRINALPEDTLQRIVLFNATDELFDDYVEYEPWVGPWTNRWREDCRLIDEREEPIPFQMLDAEAVVFTNRNDTVLPRLLFRLPIQPGEMRVLRIQRSVAVTHAPSAVSVGPNETIANNRGLRCGIDGIEWKAQENPRVFWLRPRLELFRDRTDTWSHGADRYEGQALEMASWGDPLTADRGPLMASFLSEGKIGNSALQAEWRVYADEAFADLTLRVSWQERFRLLKLTLPFPSHSDTREDGVMGGSLIRTNDGKERPLRDWTLLTGADGYQFGVVCPDVYALDASAEEVRLTLLRSSLMAHHEPAPPTSARNEFADQGVHRFRFRFFYGANLSGARLNQDAFALQRPLVVADITRGMPTILPKGMLED